MKLLPILLLTAVFFITAIMFANIIGLAKSDFRNLFVLAWSLLGALAGWKVTMASGGWK